MKYQTVSVCVPEAQCPNWTLGMDRLTWFSPAPGMRALLEKFVANGGISRYVEHDDRLEVFSDHQVLYTIYNTLEAAQEQADWTIETNVPNFVTSFTIQERPDL